MLIEKTKKRRKLSLEVLALVAICFALALVLYFIIGHFGARLVEEYCFYNDIVLDEFDYYHLDMTMYGIAFAVSTVLFVILFFSLFGERLSYIRKITEGVHAMQRGERDVCVKLFGNNELTELAEAVNYLSESEQKIKEKEKKLSAEKEELIRTLSHDIRTPLTSIMSYTELLSSGDVMTLEQQRAYLELVSQKSAQIKELTDILLEGGRRKVEYFEDATLLFIQLAAEFTDELEEMFKPNIDLLSLTAFSGSFDVGEMQRVFDNLISNVRKYAEPSEKVELSVLKADNGVVICQRNAVRKDKKPSESYKMGLNSIRRIAQGYGGTVKVSEENGMFEIIITFSNI